ncbi:MAG: hypothetical protein EBS61_03475 [Betaproteobacteria bacterium]|nr:hypothetical protein [Betaproteobacteria bacterium]
MFRAIVHQLLAVLVLALGCLASYPTVFFVGELVKLLSTIGLMAAAAVYLRWLVWPAMIAGIVLAANATWIVPMVLGRKAGNGSQSKI